MSFISYNFLPASNVDSKFFSFLNMMLNREPRIPLMWQKSVALTTGISLQTSCTVRLHLVSVVKFYTLIKRKRKYFFPSC